MHGSSGRGGPHRPAVLVLAAAVAGSIVAGCGGAAVPPANAGSAGPAATPSGVLAAGDHASAAFTPSVSFTVPAGWRLANDASAYLALFPVGNDVAGIHLFRDPQPASQAGTCPTTPEPGVGTLSTELSAWIRGLPGLRVSTPRLVSVGGLRGTELDLRIVDGWSASCPFANGVPTVPLFAGEGGDLRWVVAGSERLRLSLLDVPGGGTVVVDVDAFDGDQWDALLDAATPIVRSMQFAAGG